jgi:hypothetical protein
LLKKAADGLFQQAASTICQVAADYQHRVLRPANAERAGLTYKITDASAVVINGAAAFTR